MNKSYRIVWNKVRNCLMVVSEATKSQGKSGATKAAVVGAVAAAVMAIGAREAAAQTAYVVPGGPYPSGYSYGNALLLGTGGDSLEVQSGGSINGSNASGVDVGNGVTASFIHVSAGGTITGGVGVAINSATLAGSLINGGTIEGTIQDGINIRYGSVGGSIVNSQGGLVFSGASGTGITISNSTVSGAISNAGFIGGSSGLSLVASNIQTGVDNKGTLTGTVNGLAMVGAIAGTYYSRTGYLGSQVYGGITNSGSIIGTGPNGILIGSGSVLSGGLNNTTSGFVSGINSGLAIQAGFLGSSLSRQGYVGSTLTGGVTNSGTIKGGSFGILVAASTLSGGISNSGSIYGAIAGIAVHPMPLGNTTGSLGWIGSKLDGGIANSGTIKGGQTAIVIDSSTLNGGISNSGYIQGLNGAAISVYNSRLNGGISNVSSGTMVGVGGTAALAFTSSRIVGGITNAGLIQNTSSGGYGIGLYSASRIDNGIQNQLGGSIVGRSAAIYLVSGSQITGGITNAGLIKSTYGPAISLSSARIYNGIQNQSGGTIIGRSTGVLLASGSQITGGVTNAGLIRATSGSAIYLTSSRIDNGVQNQTGGTILGTSAGIYGNRANIYGGITNTGLITATDSYGYGIYLNRSAINGSIDNQSGGTISSGQYGIFFGSSQINGGVTNTGLISGSTALYNDNRSTVHGGIANLTGGTISGGINNLGQITNANVAVMLSNSMVVGDVVNSGSIINIGGGTVSSLFVGAGATITGEIMNDGLISGGVGISIAGSLGGGINNSGSIIGTGGTAISVSNTVPLVNVVNSVSGTVIGAISGNASVSNSGLWALQTISGSTISAGSHVNASILGNYVQNASTGVLSIGVNGTSGTGTVSGNFSHLTVGGIASLTAGSINVSMNADSAVSAGGTLAGVVTSTSNQLTATGLSITDNSALVDFIYTTNSGTTTLSLVAVTAAGCAATITGSQQGPCQVAFDNQTIYVSTTGSIGGAATGIKVLNGAITAGGIVNAGTVLGSTYGINVLQGSTFTGNIINAATGLISATSGSASSYNAGIRVSGATVSGVISNAGQVSGPYGIYIANSSIGGGIENSGTVSALGTRMSLYVGLSSIGGHILNTGTIIANNGSGMALSFTGSALVGGVSNTGLIQAATGTAVEVRATHLSNGFVNQSGGRIIGSGNGVEVTYGSQLDTLVNSAGSSIVGTNGTALFINNSTVTGVLTNAGLIQGGMAGIEVMNGGLIGGGIVNSGSISASATTASGIALLGSSLTNGILNTGTVSALGAHGTGVLLSHSTLSGGVANSGAISAGYVGLNLQDSTLSGGVANSGAIRAGYVGLYLKNSSVQNGLNNLGTIEGGSAGVRIFAGTLSGGLTNSGLIQGDIAVSAVVGSEISGGLTNTGTILGTIRGIDFRNGTTINGTIWNQGSIAGGITAINVTNSYVSGGIANTGTVVGLRTGIWVGANSTVNAGITNSGRIYGGHTGIAIVTGSSVLGGITNSGYIGGGVYAINVDSTSSLDRILITGNNTASFGGAVDAVNTAVTVAGGATYTLNSDFNVSNFANEGVVIASGSPTITGNLSNAAGASVIGAINGLTDISNSGLIALQTMSGGTIVDGSHVSTSISGNYVQNASTGILSIGVNGSSGSGTTSGNYSQLAVGGIASLTAGSINVSMSSATAVQSGGTLVGVVTSGTNQLTASGLTITDNSALVNFVYTTTAGALDLVAVANVTNCAANITGSQQGPCEIAFDNQTINIAATGSIGGAATGIKVLSGAITAGSIVNAGTVMGSAYGINVLAGSTFSGGITNSGLIAGGVNAIYVDSTSSVDRIVIAGNNTASFGGAVYAPNTPVTVAGGATYTLNSNFEVSNFANQGTLIAPVASVATPTITGNLTLGNTGTFAPTIVSQTSYSQVNVSGNAVLGGTLAVSAGSASGLTRGSVLTGLISANSVTGAFSAITDDSPLYNFLAINNGHSVGLQVVQVGGNFIAGAAQASGNLAGQGAAQALDTAAMTGAMPTVTNVLGVMPTNTQISNAVSQTLPVMSGATVWNTMSVLTGINRIIEARHLVNKGISSGEDFSGNNALWMKPFGTWTDQGNQNGAYGFKANTGGLMLGGDTTVGADTRLGLAFGWGNSYATSNAGVAPQSQTSNLYQFIGYGSYALSETLEANFQANGGWNSNTSNRQIGFMGTSAQGSYNSAVWHVGAGLSNPYHVTDTTQLIPSARFDYTWIKNQGYSETGASNGLGLNVNSETYQTSILGADLKGIQKLTDHNSVNANIGVGYNFSPTQTWVAASFQGAPGLQFTTNGINPQAVMGRAGVGYTYKVNNGLDLGVRYDIDFQNSYTNQTATAKARWMF